MPKRDREQLTRNSGEKPPLQTIFAAPKGHPGKDHTMRGH
jgi:hypothetical protein